MRTETLYACWRTVRAAANLPDVRLHDLRHSFASHAVMRGVPLPVVSRLLGHAHPRMTFRYAHVSDQETEAAAERIGVAIAAMLVEPTPSAPGRRHRKTAMRVAGPGL